MPYGALVSWQMVEDNDRSAYVVERSLNSASGFLQIGTVPVYAGTYSFEDTNFPEAKIVYYRIAKKNEEGEWVYSSIVAVYSFDLSFSLLPNPFTGNAFLHSNNDKGEYDVFLYNALGQIVESHAFKGDQSLEIGSMLVSGVYMLKVYGKDGTNEIIKLVKEK
jgi:hypothetical protein